VLFTVYKWSLLVILSLQKVAAGIILMITFLAFIVNAKISGKSKHAFACLLLAMCHLSLAFRSRVDPVRSPALPSYDFS
jgi:zinc transporter ZupT